MNHGFHASTRLRYVACAIVVVLPLLTTWLNHDPGVVNFSYLTGKLVGTAVVDAPLLAGFAAWDTSRLSRDSTIRGWRRSTRPTEAFLRVGAAWITLALLAYVVICAIVLIVAQLSGSPWGMPFWLWLGTALLGEFVAIAVGLLVGVLLPSRLTAPLTVCGVYLVILITFVLSSGLGPRVQWLSIAVEQYMDVFSTVSWRFLVVQAAWYSGLIAISLSLAILRVTHSRVTGVLVLSTGLLLATGGACGVLSSRTGLLVDAPYAKVTSGNCVGYHPVVCLHPSFGKPSRELNAALHAVWLRSSDTPFAFAKVMQAPRGGQPPPSGYSSIYIDDRRTGWASAAVEEFAQDELSGGAHGSPCVATTTTIPVYLQGLSTIPLAWLSADTLAVNISQREQAAVGHWDKMSARAKKLWLYGHVREICNGTLSVRDFR